MAAAAVGTGRRSENENDLYYAHKREQENSKTKIAALGTWSTRQRFSLTRYLRLQGSLGVPSPLLGLFPRQPPYLVKLRLRGSSAGDEGFPAHVTLARVPLSGGTSSLEVGNSCISGQMVFTKQAQS